MNDAGSGLAAVLALDPDLAARLLTEHGDRGDGRCRVCALGNQAGHHRWPCTIYTAAGRAIEMSEPAVAHGRERG